MNDMDNVRRAVAAWTDWRNDHAKGVDWQFNTDDARKKRKSIYPIYHFENESFQKFPTVQYLVGKIEELGEH